MSVRACLEHTAYSDDPIVAQCFAIDLHAVAHTLFLPPSVVIAKLHDPKEALCVEAVVAEDSKSDLGVNGPADLPTELMMGSLGIVLRKDLTDPHLPPQPYGQHRGFATPVQIHGSVHVQLADEAAPLLGWRRPHLDLVALHSQHPDSVLFASRQHTEHHPLPTTPLALGGPLCLALQRTALPVTDLLVLNFPSLAGQKAQWGYLLATTSSGLVGSDTPRGLQAATGMLLIVPPASPHALYQETCQFPSLPDKNFGLEHAQLSVEGTMQRARMTLQLDYAVGWLGAVFVVMAALCTTTMGLALRLVTFAGVPPAIALVWRSEAVVVCLLPLFLAQVMKASNQQWLLMADTKLFLCWLMAVLGLAIWIGTFSLALDRTTTSRAIVYSNAHSLLLLAIRLFSRLPTNLGAALGGFSMLTGIALGVAGDIYEAVHGTHKGSWDRVTGDGLALLGSCGCSLYLVGCKVLRKRVPLFLFLFPVHLVSTAVLMLCVLGVMRQGARPDTDPIIGLFGLAATDRLGYSVYAGLVTGLLGLVAIIGALRFTPTLYVSAALLLTSVCMGGTALAIDREPIAPWSLGAGLLLVGGAALAMSSTKRHQVLMDVTSHLCPLPSISPISASSLLSPP